MCPSMCVCVCLLRFDVLCKLTRVLCVGRGVGVFRSMGLVFGSCRLVQAIMLRFRRRPTTHTGGSRASCGVDLGCLFFSVLSFFPFFFSSLLSYCSCLLVERAVVSHLRSSKISPQTRLFVSSRRWFYLRDPSCILCRQRTRSGLRPPYSPAG